MTKTDATESAADDAASAPAEPTVHMADPTENAVKSPVGWIGTVAVILILAALAGTAVATWPEWRHLMGGQFAQQPAPPPAMMSRSDMGPPSGTMMAPPSGMMMAPPSGMMMAGPSPSGADLDARMRVVEERLKVLSADGAAAALAPLEKRLDEIDRQTRALAGQPALPARLGETVDGLSKQVADLSRTSADAAAVLRIADRLDKVEAQMRDLQARRESAGALLLSVGLLRDALARAQSYDAELRAFLALAARAPHLAGGDVAQAAAVLKPHAQSGVPAVGTLSARLDSQIPAIVRADVLPDDADWRQRTLDRLSALVSIRREDGDAAGTSPAAITARARAALAQNDLAAAVAEIDQLQGAPAQAAAVWLADARARLESDRAIAGLSAHVIAAIGAGD